MRFILLFASLFPCFAQLAEQSVRLRPPVVRSPSNIRIDVNMALVPVTVMDQAGHNVTGLRRENFRVIDGAREVPIMTFGRQDQPISVGLVYDCSRSMTQKFKTSREAPHQLFEQLNASDESFLVTVSDKAELRRGLTSDLNEVENALVFTHPTGATSLIDGIYLGLQELKKAHNPRRALVVVSDGGDNNSRYTMRELEKIAVEADAQIFAIGLYQNPQTREEEDGPALLTKLAGDTGGVNFIVQNLDHLRLAMGRIGVTLHNQYVLGYYPPDEAPAGKYRKIKVQLMLPPGTPQLRLFARSGYYVPER
jgi:Ca-activated chloride channel homolog